jgi:hypothetical protein
VTEEPRSYYGRPVIKEPVWTPEVPFYFFFGGLAGASAGLAAGASLTGREELARKSWIAALVAIAVSPPLLISDLGRPKRFLNMLRVFKISSPMSVGSWTASAAAAAITVAAGTHVTGRFRALGTVAEGAAALIGAPLVTYTAVLLADTAVPAWHEARRELPFVFAGSAAASAGGCASIFTSPEEAGPARRLTVFGALLEAGALRLMERRLGELAEPYRTGPAGRLGRAAKALTAAGAGIAGLAGRRRAAARIGGAMVVTGSLLLRFGVFRAGVQSARNPRYTLDPQRRRLESQ